jgi:hypothetical protein
MHLHVHAETEGDAEPIARRDVIPAGPVVIQTQTPLREHPEVRVYVPCYKKPGRLAIIPRLMSVAQPSKGLLEELLEASHGCVKFQVSRDWRKALVIEDPNLVACDNVHVLPQKAPAFAEEGLEYHRYKFCRIPTSFVTTIAKHNLLLRV